MKRFYKEVTAVETEGGYGIALDGRPVRTPARALLVLPGWLLAHAIVQEWERQITEIDPGSMPMTGLANAAIDHVLPEPKGFAATISSYGENDLLCYCAEEPEELVVQQLQAWQPLLDWATARYDIGFAVTRGIVHVAQPEGSLERLRAVVVAYDAFTLAALHTLVTLSGSLIIGLAAVERVFPAAQLWQAAELDELWQADQWGDDDEALARRVRRHDEFMMAAEFAELARS